LTPMACTTIMRALVVPCNLFATAVSHIAASRVTPAAGTAAMVGRFG